MAYSVDLINKVIEYRKVYTLEETKEAFKVSVSTIMDWEKLLDEKGNLKKRPLNRT